MSAIYAGPQCPSCNAPLEHHAVSSGPMDCPYCNAEFEATAFQPRERRHAAVQIVTETPDGVAAACANHSRNAAVTSCARCGLFICALCDMNVGEGSYCPSCFDQSRDQNVLAATQTRYRDYATMAFTASLLGFLCSIVPFGAFAIYWGVKGIRQRREEGTGIAGPVVAIVLGSLQTLALLTGIVMIVIGVIAGDS